MAAGGCSYTDFLLQNKDTRQRKNTSVKLVHRKSVLTTAVIIGKSIETLAKSRTVIAQTTVRAHRVLLGTRSSSRVENDLRVRSNVQNDFHS